MGNDFVDHVLDLLDKKKLMNIRSSAVYMEWDKNKDKIVLPSEQFNEITISKVLYTKRLRNA